MLVSELPPISGTKHTSARFSETKLVALRRVILDQLLCEARGADGDDKAAADLQLRRQCGWHAFGPCRYQNGIEWRKIRPAERAVAVPEVDVGMAGIRQGGGGLLGELRDPLDGVDVACDLGENRCCIAGARADLQHGLAALELQGLDHERDDIRLGNRLARTNGQRHVGVGTSAQPPRHKLFARHRPHCLEDQRIAHPAGRHLACHHPVAQLDHACHVGSSGAASASFRAMLVRSARARQERRLHCAMKCLPASGPAESAAQAGSGDRPTTLFAGPEYPYRPLRRLGRNPTSNVRVMRGAGLAFPSGAGAHLSSQQLSCRLKLAANDVPRAAGRVDHAMEGNLHAAKSGPKA